MRACQGGEASAGTPGRGPEWFSIQQASGAHISRYGRRKQRGSTILKPGPEKNCMQFIPLLMKQ